MTRGELSGLLVRIALCVAILALVVKVIDTKTQKLDAEAVTTQETTLQGAGREVTAEQQTQDTETTENDTLYRATEDTDFAEWYTEEVTEAQTEAVEASYAPPTVECEPQYDNYDAVLIAKTIGVEAPYCSTMEQAAVAWTILNRVDDDRFPNTIYEVLTAPRQFAYFPTTPVRADLYYLALDVLARWGEEKAGEVNVGRVLPSEFVYYDGDGIAHNYFRVYEGAPWCWDWSLENPYFESEENE